MYLSGFLISPANMFRWGTADLCWFLDPTINQQFFTLSICSGHFSHHFVNFKVNFWNSINVLHQWPEKRRNSLRHNALNSLTRVGKMHFLLILKGYECLVNTMCILCALGSVFPSSASAFIALEGADELHRDTVRGAGVNKGEQISRFKCVRGRSPPPRRLMAQKRARTSYSLTAFCPTHALIFPFNEITIVKLCLQQAVSSSRFPTGDEYFRPSLSCACTHSSVTWFGNRAL